MVGQDRRLESRAPKNWLLAFSLIVVILPEANRCQILKSPLSELFQLKKHKLISICLSLLF